MSPEQEFSYCYLELEVGYIYTTVSIKLTLVPTLNVEVIGTNMELHRGVRTLSQIKV